MRTCGGQLTAAAPYIHPRLAAIEYAGTTGGKPVSQMTDPENNNACFIVEDDHPSPSVSESTYETHTLCSCQNAAINCHRDVFRR
jgi:hypothetical protein